LRSDAEIVADGSIVCCGSLAGKVWLMIELGKTLLGLGLLLVVIGGVLVLSGRLGLPIGKLPGDIAYKGKSFYFAQHCAVGHLLSSLALSSLAAGNRLSVRLPLH
jgi:hypothetical protein